MILSVYIELTPRIQYGQQIQFSGIAELAGWVVDKRLTSSQIMGAKVIVGRGGTSSEV